MRSSGWADSARTAGETSAFGYPLI